MGRLSIWWEIVGPTWRWGVVIPVTILGAIGAVRDDLIAPQHPELFKLVHWLPDWSWQTYSVCIAAVLLLFVLEGAYRAVAKREFDEDFEFVFVEYDPRFVKQEPNKVQFFVGLHIKARQSILLPSVRYPNSPFTERVLYDAHRQQNKDGERPIGYVIIYKGGALDWKATELLFLCELPYWDHLSKDDVLGRPQTFQLEARGRNVKTAFANFEYDPNKRPMIRLFRN
jgi:hypothetical protein